MQVRKPCAEQPEQLQHRLVDQLGIGAGEAGVAGRAQPVLDDGVERLGRHAGVGDADDLDEAARADAGDGLRVAGEDGAEGFLRLPFRVLRGEGAHAVQREGELVVHGQLGPERAVIVEDAEALAGRDEIRAALGGGGGEEVEDGLAAGAVVPGGERRVGRLRRGGAGRRKRGEEGGEAAAGEVGHARPSRCIFA